MPLTRRRALLLVLWAAGCATEPLRPFPLAEALWVDPDQTPYRGAPPEFYSPYIWDGANYSVFRPLVYLWRFEASTAATNVNAFDEVPGSSWFQNRIGLHTMSPAEAARGACDDAGDAIFPPWTVTAGKPDGASPGFVAKDARGKRFLVKTDGLLQQERPTAADAIGAALFHTVGYFTPCNRVVHLRPEDLRLKPGAEIKRTSGAREPMTQLHVQAVLDKAMKLPGGEYRVGVSEFIEGRPISPWRFEGVWEDDPNDVIPHENRREIRGMRVLAAWINHLDSRQENNLASWISTGPEDVGYVRHYKLDVGDSFGILQGPEGFHRRFGHSGYFDPEHIVLDFVSLGLIDRPWYHAELGPAGRTLGYFSAQAFDPDAWRPGYPNPAFDAADEADKAWMARIIARISPAHVQALVSRGRWTLPYAEEELLRVLLERRRILLERYLGRRSPLTAPRLEDRRLCLEDLAVVGGIRLANSRAYSGTLYGRGAAAVSLPVSSEPVCLSLPEAPPEASGPVIGGVNPPAGAIAPLYAFFVLDVRALDQPAPLRLHLYAAGGAWKLAGLERPASAEEPGW